MECELVCLSVFVFIFLIEGYYEGPAKRFVIAVGFQNAAFY